MLVMRHGNDAALEPKQMGQMCGGTLWLGPLRCLTMVMGLKGAPSAQLLVIPRVCFSSISHYCTSRTLRIVSVNSHLREYES
jgi:hypothetical protein